MQWVEVLVDLPLKEAIYKYAVPDHLLGQAEYGRRVTVELGKRHIEGFIISDPSLGETEISVKAIMKVLDMSPVFDKELYHLARWMADTYLCPLSTALKEGYHPFYIKRVNGWFPAQPGGYD